MKIQIQIRCFLFCAKRSYFDDDDNHNNDKTVTVNLQQKGPVYPSTLMKKNIVFNKLHIYF